MNPKVSYDKLWVEEAHKNDQEKNQKYKKNVEAIIHVVSIVRRITKVEIDGVCTTVAWILLLNWDSDWFDDWISKAGRSDDWIFKLDVFEDWISTLGRFDDWISKVGWFDDWNSKTGRFGDVEPDGDCIDVIPLLS